MLSPNLHRTLFPFTASTECMKAPTLRTGKGAVLPCQPLHTPVPPAEKGAPRGDFMTWHFSQQQNEGWRWDQGSMGAVNSLGEECLTSSWLEMLGFCWLLGFCDWDCWAFINLAGILLSSLTHYLSYNTTASFSYGCRQPCLILGQLTYYMEKAKLIDYVIFTFHCQILDAFQTRHGRLIKDTWDASIKYS